MEFKDNFSKHSSIYRTFRPEYPDALFEYLALLSPSQSLAWDSGTGNGQAARGLAKYFEQVIATDPSASQISNAPEHPKVIYKVEKAEESSREDNSVDLVTAAQALHWFDLEKYYQEVRRVLKKNGIIAVWSYHIGVISPEVDKLVHDFHKELDPFWNYENRLVDDEYTTIPFPFPPIQSKEFYMTKEVTADDWLGLIRSWSAVQRYIDEKGTNPVELIEEPIKKAWQNGPKIRKATWRLFLKVGQNY